jgi:hypothetical protein
MYPTLYVHPAQSISLYFVIKVGFPHKSREPLIEPWPSTTSKQNKKKILPLKKTKVDSLIVRKFNFTNKDAHFYICDIIRSAITWKLT